MQLVDYTHPGKVPALRLPVDRRAARYYLRLDELPYGHPYYSREWGLFRYPEWLEGGSAWFQAKEIANDLSALAEAGNMDELRPVVGSADPAFDEALAQALKLRGFRPMVADVLPREYLNRSKE
ncbi:cell division protein FtsK [Novimethylophilus kurashikiensis]|uniref:Cell division protein FtsK n=2 Tax=Novimethylophilus kurashikiensis TaxID=1825523 RepID=A0A2R5F7Z5_9PROT|nr:cell division protein FtsK [Novimethylophilus kurashikiensis]